MHARTVSGERIYAPVYRVAVHETRRRRSQNILDDGAQPRRSRLLVAVKVRSNGDEFGLGNFIGTRSTRKPIRIARHNWTEREREDVDSEDAYLARSKGKIEARI